MRSSTSPARRLRAVDRNWELEVGSLGSGNHFIELALDEDDRVWAVLHSGSRGIGNKLAERYIRQAREESKRRGDKLPDPDLAWLVEGTASFDAYVADLHWAQSFARMNRDEMMDRVMGEIARAVGRAAGEIEVERINCHHNFTQKEVHFGEEVWVTRKGAIQMKEGQRGVIPGSMGTRSYIVSGRGERRLRLGAARRGPPLLAHRGAQALHDGRLHGGDAGHRVPPLERAARRAARRLQGHRHGDRAQQGPGARSTTCSSRCST
jgi:tRNA-splicing ligase RtcB